MAPLAAARGIAATACLAFCCGIALPARGDAIEANSRVREVTVYSDRAEVVREARVRLPAGASSIEIAGIPFGVEADSVRATATGVPTVLGAVDLVERARKPEESPEWVAARDEVEQLEAALAALAEQNTVDEALRAFLVSLQAATAQTASRDLGEGRADPAAIEAVYKMLAVRLEELSQRRLERARRRQELETELRLARAHLGTLGQAGDVRSRIAIVEVVASQPGDLTLKLAYITPGASWRTSYRATLAPDSGDVDLVVEGVVRQSTREDWTDVDLSLSSATPARGLTPPFLDTAVVQPGYPVYAKSDGDGARADAPQDMAMRQGGIAAAAPPALDEVAAEAEYAQAAIERSAYSVLFRVAGRSTVPADGRDHRVTLRSETLHGTLIHRVVPGLDPRAYLTARVTGPADHPLLAGPARVFSGGAYLGMFAVEEKGPGAELNVPAGVDNRLEVERVRQPPSSGKGGLGGNRTEVEYDYRTKLHNLHERTLQVVLEDRVPVSQDERIVVEIDDKRTTKGYEESPHRPGVKLWTFELGPGEKRDVDFVYSVSYPRDLVVIGLD